MLYVGIDVASRKHDCCIIDGDGTMLRENIIIKNNIEGFESLLSQIRSFSCKNDFSDVKIGLEATGHYNKNITEFLRKHNFNVTVLNPLQVNLAQQADTLRKTRTDKSVAIFIAKMMFSRPQPLKQPVQNEIEELRELVRHRSRLVEMSAKFKVSVSRIVSIVFPELPEAVWSIHQKSAYAMLLEYPSAQAVADSHLTKLCNILHDNSKGKYGRPQAEKIRTLARNPIGSPNPSYAFELQQTIRLIQNLQLEINLLDLRVRAIMDSLHSPIMTIPGISYRLGSVILAEIGNIHNFQNPNKLLKFAGLEPSVHESGTYKSTNEKMVKRGSKYLRWAILTASRLVAMRDSTFKSYSAKKKSEGKSFWVVSSHVARKLVRVIFHLLITNSVFHPQS
jgi:transposase